MSVFMRKSTKKSAAIPTTVKISEDDKPLAQSDFNVGKITEIQSRFQGGEVLIAAGRIFVREGTLMKVCRKGPKPRHFFLFKDVLVYGTILSKGHYAQQHVLSLDQMSVSAECHYMPQVYSPDGELDLHLDVENAFQINHREKSFHVFASSATDKSNWLSNLKKYITKAQDGRETVQLMTRAVWVPDSCVNECMCCKKKFTTFNRKHHCRNCGKVACGQCSSMKVDLLVFQGQTPPQGLDKPERVCTDCYSLATKPIANKPKDGSKQVTIVDARPMHSDTQPVKKPDPEKPPPPASEASKQMSQALLACAEQTADQRATARQLANQAVASKTATNTPLQTGNEDEESSNGTSDSDDSDNLEDPEKEELKLTRRGSLLSGSSWEVISEKKTKATTVLHAGKLPGSVEGSPQAPPRRKRQVKGQESPETGRPADKEKGQVNVCVKCDKELSVGEFGFLEEQCLCKEHFKERYEELHGPVANGKEESKEHEAEAPKAKPRPIPRKQKESIEEKDEKHEVTIEDAPPPQPEEKSQEEQVNQENPVEQEEQAGSEAGSEAAKPVRGRKPNRFKKVEVKKQEEQIKEATSHDDTTTNLLGDENELLGPDRSQSSATAPVSQAAVDDLLKMTDNDNVVPTEQLVSLETDPSVLALSHNPLVPESSATPEAGSPPQAKPRRKKTKFKPKSKDASEKDEENQ